MDRFEKQAHVERMKWETDIAKQVGTCGVFSQAALDGAEILLKHVLMRECEASTFDKRGRKRYLTRDDKQFLRSSKRQIEKTIEDAMNMSKTEVEIETMKKRGQW